MFGQKSHHYMIIAFPALQGKILCTLLCRLSPPTALCFLCVSWGQPGEEASFSLHVRLRSTAAGCYLLHCVSQKAKAAVSVSVGVHPGPQKLQKGFLFHRLTLWIRHRGSIVLVEGKWWSTPCWVTNRIPEAATQQRNRIICAPCIDLEDSLQRLSAWRV